MDGCLALNVDDRFQGIGIGKIDKPFFDIKCRALVLKASGINPGSALDDGALKGSGDMHVRRQIQLRQIIVHNKQVSRRNPDIQERILNHGGKNNFLSYLKASFTSEQRLQRIQVHIFIIQTFQYDDFSLNCRGLGRAVKGQIGVQFGIERIFDFDWKL